MQNNLNMENWHKSGKGLREYLGDKLVKIDEDIKDYLNETLPPIRSNGSEKTKSNLLFLKNLWDLEFTDFVQCSEPWEHNAKGQALYQSVALAGGEWYSIGLWPNLNNQL